jgi:hypothetical protein
MELRFNVDLVITGIITIAHVVCLNIFITKLRIAGRNAVNVLKITEAPYNDGVLPYSDVEL